MAFWDTILADVESAPARFLNPVYNNLGRRVGWFMNDAALAAGQVVYDAGEKPPQGAPVTLSVMHPGLPSDNQVPVTSLTSVEFYLVSKGLQPAWLGPAGSGGLVDAMTGAQPQGITGNLPSFNLPQLPNLTSWFQDPATGGWDIGKLAIVGAFGLLAVVLVTRDA